MSELRIIGVDSGSLSIRQQAQLRGCSLIVCGKRFAHIAEEHMIPMQSITPIKLAFMAIEEKLDQWENVAVLASGDPLFFGIARKLLDHFGRTCITIFPGLSSMQEAFARFRMPWDDAACISLHGRKATHIPGLLLRQPKSCVLTDPYHSPDSIARSLLSYLDTIEEPLLKNSVRLHVAENIGAEDEKLTSGTIEKIAQEKFAPLNVVCVEIPDRKAPVPFGLTEDDIIHSRGLITKDEVRAASLHKLALPHDGVLWDVGGGSGSIAIEAAALCPRLTVYTIEKDEEQLENIRRNIRKFGCYSVIPVQGSAPDVLAKLPAPDRVFVGGSGGKLEPIIRYAAERLPAGGKLVVNGVIAKTINEAPRLMADRGLTVSVSTVTVTRTGDDAPVHFNPIAIMVGVK